MGPLRYVVVHCFSAVMVDTPATAVPPRATSHGTNGRGRSQTIVRNQDFRQLLIGMGFPHHRAYVMGGKGGGWNRIERLMMWVNIQCILE